ncbi:MAG: hypothetical protein IJ716_11700 [Lachnospiraceae bacterium]|nr:hypothetical protein [Lachnospiraceae bacterium]
MSEQVVKIIPKDINMHMDKIIVSQLVDYIRKQMGADAVDYTEYGAVTFIDCGSNLETIYCPECGKVIDFGWWGEAMDMAGENKFVDLRVVLPCCGEESSLNHLEYYFPCGFAKEEIAIRNLQVAIDEKYRSAMEKIAGVELKIIEAHY